MEGDQSEPLLATKEYLFKILVIGDFGVGKTAIVRRYTEGQFSSNYKITIGADFAIKSLQWDQCTKINIQLWDIAGHERFGYMTRVYYKYAVAAALVCDVSRLATFQSIEKWLIDLREKVSLEDGVPVPVILLANKCDISNPVINTEHINRFCNKSGILKWFQTSAKENININECMIFLVEKILEIKQKESREGGIILDDTNNTTPQKHLCCS